MNTRALWAVFVALAAARELQDAADGTEICNFDEDRIKTNYACTLEEYCDTLQSNGYRTTCTGDLDGVLTFHSVGPVECKQNWLGNDTDVVSSCYRQTDLYRIKGYRFVTRTAQYNFVSGGLSVNYTAQASFCGASDTIDTCSCDVYFNSRNCKRCEPCFNGELTRGAFWYELDCSNVGTGLTTSCEYNETWGDILARAERALDPDSNVGCNYTSHLENGRLKCTVDEYCQFLDDNTNARYKDCTGDTSAEYQMSYAQSTCYDEGEGWLDPPFDVCFDESTTIRYNHTRPLSTNRTYEYTKGLEDFQTTVELIYCEDGVRACGCGVWFGDQKCQSCTICGPADANGTIWFDEDCSNIAPGLTYGCDESHTSYVYFLQEAQSVLAAKEAKKQKDSSNSFPVVPVVIGAVGAVVLIAAVATIAVRRQSSSKQHDSTDNNENDDWMAQHPQGRQPAAPRPQTPAAPSPPRFEKAQPQAIAAPVIVEAEPLPDW